MDEQFISVAQTCILQKVRKGGDQWDAALWGRLPGGGVTQATVQVSGVSTPAAKLAQGGTGLWRPSLLSSVNVPSGPRVDYS